MAIVHLIEIRAYDMDAGAEKILRFTDMPDRSATTLGGVLWRGRASVDPLAAAVMEISADFGPAAGRVSLASISLTLEPEDLAEIAPLVLDGRTVTIKRGQWRDAYSNYNLLHTGEIASAPYTTGSDGLTRMTIGLSALGGFLDVPLLSATYAGTGDIEGPSGLEGTPKPAVFGTARNIEMVQLDAAALIYQFHGYGPAASVDELFQRGVSMGSPAANYGTYAALKAATVEPGQYATCLAEGLVRLGGQVQEPLTADVEGDTAAGRRAAGIIERMTAIAGISASKLDSASFAAFDAVESATISWVQTSQIDVGAAATEILKSFFAYWTVSADSKMQLGRIRTGGPELTVPRMPTTLAKVSDEVKPLKELKLGYKPVWRVQRSGEVNEPVPGVVASMGKVDQLLTGNGRGSVIRDEWFNFYDATGASGWKHTSGWDYVTSFVRSDGHTVNALRYTGGSGDTLEYRSGKRHRSKLKPGGRTWNDRFNTRHKKQTEIVVYGEQRADEQGRAANGKAYIAIIFYDADGRFISEVHSWKDGEENTIDIGEKIGSEERRFVTPKNAVTGEVHIIVRNCTQGYWYFSGSEGTAFAPAIASSALNQRHAPKDPGATDGATLGINTYDVDGIVRKGDELVTADGQLEVGPGYNFNGGLQGWSANDATLGYTANSITLTTTGSDPRLYSPPMNLKGSEYTHVRVRMRRTTPDPQGTTFEWMQLHWETGGHGITSGFKNNTNHQLTEEFKTFVFDMRKPTAGGDDWISSTIKAIRFDPTVTVGDGLEIEAIQFCKIAAAAVPLVTSNLADEAGLTELSLDATAGEQVIGAKDLEDLDLYPFDKISLSLQVFSSGTKRGRLGIRYRNASGSILAESWSDYAVVGTTYQTVGMVGETIPANTARVQWLFEREASGTGQVACRRLNMNIGDIIHRMARVRSDVAVGADVTNYLDNRISNDAQTLENLGAGPLASLQQITKEYIEAHGVNQFSNKGEFTTSPVTSSTEKLQIVDFYNVVNIPGKEQSGARQKYYGYIRDYAGVGGNITLHIYRKASHLSPATTIAGAIAAGYTKVHEGPLYYGTSETFFSIDFQDPDSPPGSIQYCWYIVPTGTASWIIRYANLFWQPLS